LTRQFSAHIISPMNLLINYSNAFELFDCLISIICPYQSNIHLFLAYSVMHFLIRPRTNFPHPSVMLMSRLLLTACRLRTFGCSAGLRSISGLRSIPGLRSIAARSVRYIRIGTRAILCLGPVKTGNACSFDCRDSFLISSVC
jgi:hypothetical protein